MIVISVYLRDMEPTKRQIEALKLIATGESIDQTAHQMGVTRSTVEKALSEVRKRLNAKSLYHAVHIATKKGLLSVLCLMIGYVTISPDHDVMKRAPRTRRPEQSSSYLNDF